MSLEINDLQVAGINSYFQCKNLLAKRSRINPNEIIIGVTRNHVGCVTVKLTKHFRTKQPCWYVGYFRNTTPGELSTLVEITEIPELYAADSWEKMLRVVNHAV